MHDDAFNETALGAPDHSLAALPKIPSGDGSAGAAVLEPATARITERIAAGDPWDAYRAGGDLVIEEQPMTAIYENTVGAIVIRQLDVDGHTDNDPFVRFLPHYAPAVIRKIAELAGYQVSISREPIPLPAAQGRAAAPGRKRGEPTLFGDQR